MFLDCGEGVGGPNAGTWRKFQLHTTACWIRTEDLLSMKQQGFPLSHRAALHSIPSGQKLRGRSFICQQDNKPAHAWTLTVLGIQSADLGNLSVTLTSALLNISLKMKSQIMENIIRQTRLGYSVKKRAGIIQTLKFCKHVELMGRMIMTGKIKILIFNEPFCHK